MAPIPTDETTMLMLKINEMTRNDMVKRTEQNMNELQATKNRWSAARLSFLELNSDWRSPDARLCQERMDCLEQRIEAARQVLRGLYATETAPPPVQRF